MILNALTIFHVVLSLLGIGSGVVAIYGLLKAKTPGRWTQVFLATMAATSLLNVVRKRIWGAGMGENIAHGRR